MVLVGLLKRIKGRRACLPLAHRFYLPKKAIASKSDNMAIPGEATLFQAKPEQATEMLAQLADHFAGMPIADHASMEHDWARVLKWQQGSKQRHRAVACFSMGVTAT